MSEPASAPVPAAVPARPAVPPAAAAPAPSEPAPAPAGQKVRVRVTMFADPIDVDPGEIPALRGQGLLAEDPIPAATEGTPS
jgi:hypothetical protein